MKYLQSFPLFSSLKDSELIMLDTLTEKKEYKKDTVLLEKSQVSKKLIFLNQGIVASVYEDRGKKFIRDFYFPPLIFTEQESFVKQIPAKFSILSVTDIICHLITKDSLDIAYERIPSLKEIGNELLFNGFVNISNRLESLLTLNPEKRYLKLLNENPKLLNKIPLKLIASYLGITDVALSRIRKRISLPKK
ncbi:MAG: hypothetical protein CMF94_01445 [Candidatus Marinimicrobia bacterium]|nr:hypothetical protein [Candidatus Neomarinimicrobiota bacterium]|tara:strand:+ start:257 stop:832 length:576 start_codon:yes stop_codon:yes gene_type:complete